MRNNIIYFFICVVYGALILLAPVHLGLHHIHSLFLAPLMLFFHPVILIFFWGVICAFLPSNIFLIIVGTILGQFISIIPDMMSPPSSAVGASFSMAGQVFMLCSGFLILVGYGVGRILNKLTIKNYKRDLLNSSDIL